MTKYNCAVIGFGNIGPRHAKWITERSNRAVLKGVYDFRPEIKSKIEDAGFRSYETLQELIDDDVQLVVIATPNDSHSVLAKKLLRAGKNVICEKPAALSSADVAEVIEVAKETGKLLSYHQNRRWDVEYLTGKKILDSGYIGKPYFIEVNIQNGRRGMYGWRGHKGSGGMTLDWGSHVIDYLLCFDKSKVISVDCHLKRLFAHGVDDNIRIFLNFESGLSAIIEITTNTFITKPRWFILGDNGTASIDLIRDSFLGDGAVNTKVVTIDSCTEKDGIDILYNGDEIRKVPVKRSEITTSEVAVESVPNPTYRYYDNIFDVLDGKAELMVKPEEAVRVMKVIEAVFEADKLGHGIKTDI